MATGGWKWGQFVYQYGMREASEDDSRYALRRSKEIIAAFADYLIKSGEGWAFDSEFTKSADDFTTIGDEFTYNFGSICQFLKHENGTRLCARYCVRFRCIDKTLEMKTSSYTNITNAGLSISIIPSGSPNKWDLSNNCTTSSFIPTDATRFVSNSTRTDNYGESVVYHDYNWGGSKTIKYSFGVRGDSVFIAINGVSTDKDASKIDLCFAGRLFGVLSQSEDVGYQSKYGAFMSATSSEYYRGSNIFNSQSEWNGVYSTYFRSTVDTLPPSGLDSNSQSLKCFNSNAAAINSGVIDNIRTGKTLFGAIGFYISSIDPQTYGVTKGNGMKGYADTDVFRAVYPQFSYGTLFDGGRFIYLGGGWAIGWDPSNTINLR